MREIPNLSLDKFKQFLNQWLTSCFCFYLVIGNTTVDKCKEMVAEIEKKFEYIPLHRDKFVDFRPVNFIKNYSLEEKIEE